jgi:hypothetical protein
MTKFTRFSAALLLGLVTASAAVAEQVRVNNNTNVVLYRLYFSEVSDNNWGPDQLGNGVVRPGGAAVITIPGGRNCNWDFLVEYEDGVQDQFVVNVCETGTINLN